MITKLKIANFKSHKDTQLNLGSLTLLTGLNSSGKSSAIQTLLLLRQSFKKGRLSKGLDLNEPLCDIGKGDDALYRYAKNSEIISFNLETSSNKQYVFSFDTHGKYDDSFLPATERINLSEDLLSLPVFSNNFQYLSAGRVAAVEFYPIDSYSVEEERQISRNYGQGELVAHFLEYYGNNRNFNVASDLLLHKSTSSKKLIDQVIAWEQEISPRLNITTKKVADKITLEFGYKSEDETVPLSKLKSKNIGFGISYSLAIVVAVLSASPGSLILIENPEAHLHPRGQSKLSELICLAAQSGIQIIVETHSDHIFNGIRKSINSGLVKKDNVRVHYFKTNGQNTTVSTEIQLSEKGKVLNHVPGLFDQFDNDLDELIGL
jgi:predicted ATPase